MSDEFMRAIKKAQQKDIGAPLFNVGGNVRVLSRIDVNFPEGLGHWLGVVCKVDSVLKRGMLNPVWVYDLYNPVSNTTCEFQDCDLDKRYKIKSPLLK